MSVKTSADQETTGFVRAASLEELKGKDILVVHVEGHTVALFYHQDRVFAVDNRCPHMGFPLDRGSVHDCILTCHWHHARFDLETGGTFDQFAGDVRSFPTKVVGDEVYIDVRPKGDYAEQMRGRLRLGLERNLTLVVGKSVIGMLSAGVDPAVPFRAGLDFGATYRRTGWGMGMTMHTCLFNLLPTLDENDRAHALYHGLSAVTRELSGDAPRFVIEPLPDATTDVATLKRWFRQFVEVRDSEGAERCIVTAIRSGGDDRQMADMLFAAATDHRYINIGHVADFTNKAFEALDHIGWEHAERILTTLPRGFAFADRMEESNAWRHPIDLVSMLEAAFEVLPETVESAEAKPGRWPERDALVETILADDPQASVDAMMDALRSGCDPVELASIVTYCAARRIAHFHKSNDFNDWDTALHTFTFAHAIEQGLRRSPSVETLRGVFDAATSVYLDRFLNVPSVPLPKSRADDPDAVLAEIPAMLDKQQQIAAVGKAVGSYLYGGGDPDRLIALLGRMLLREDRDFHTIQTFEAAVRQFQLNRDAPEGPHFLIAAARYLAAHAPTVRAQKQTFDIASRLHRGENVFEDDEAG
ncbi:MAG: Rieske (2Fe-2S) protein [Armatimonadetes bacterium]|nr:Rieske (2Fe-2S) protein [Armatimonadota bacterium]